MNESPESKLREALEALVKHGTHFSTCPRRRLHEREPIAQEIDEWWMGYFAKADKTVRDIARAALAESVEAPTEPQGLVHPDRALSESAGAAAQKSTERKALAELLAISEIQLPEYEAGREAQDAWYERRRKAYEAARAALTEAPTAEPVIGEAADLLGTLGRLCSTQGGQLLKDAARDAVKMAARLRTQAATNEVGGPATAATTQARPYEPRDHESEALIAKLWEAIFSGQTYSINEAIDAAMIHAYADGRKTTVGESVEAPAPPEPLTNTQIVKLWGPRSDGPDNHEIISFAHAILATQATAVASRETPLEGKFRIYAHTSHVSHDDPIVYPPGRQLLGMAVKWQYLESTQPHAGDDQWLKMQAAADEIDRALAATWANS